MRSHGSSASGSVGRRGQALLLGLGDLAEDLLLGIEVVVEGPVRQAGRSAMSTMRASRKPASSNTVLAATIRRARPLALPGLRTLRSCSGFTGSSRSPRGRPGLGEASATTSASLGSKLNQPLMGEALGQRVLVAPGHVLDDVVADCAAQYVATPL